MRSMIGATPEEDDAERRRRHSHGDRGNERRATSEGDGLKINPASTPGLVPLRGKPGEPGWFGALRQAPAIGVAQHASSVDLVVQTRRTGRWAAEGKPRRRVVRRPGNRLSWRSRWRRPFRAACPHDAVSDLGAQSPHNRVAILTGELCDAKLCLSNFAGQSDSLSGGER
jgi:hypothetical protein